MTVKAIHQNGVFRPVNPVSLPEMAEVEVLLPTEVPEDAEFAQNEKDRQEIIEILSRSYDTGDPGLAERHNEIQRSGRCSLIPWV
jgi:predicted DNA-binding antitoxin AbrB/MazE fold protein